MLTGFISKKTLDIMAYAASLAGDNLPHFATRQLACCSTREPRFDTAETQFADGRSVKPPVTSRTQFDQK